VATALESPGLNSTYEGKVTSIDRRLAIAVLVDWLYDDYQNTVFAGVRAALEEAGADVFCFVGGALGTLERYSQSRTFVYDLVSAKKCDGVVVLSGSLGNFVGPTALGEFCRRFEPLPMCSISVSLPDMPCVLVDNTTGMRAVIGHLIEVHGRRRIAFIRGPSENEEAERRFAVYREVLADHGVPFAAALVLPGNFNRVSGAEAIAVLCDERRTSFDALVGANDNMVLGAMHVLHQRRIRVPHEVAVVGFDDVEEARFASVPLTTVRQPLYEQGRAAAAILLARCRGLAVPEQHVLDTEVVLRQSCGCFSESLLGPAVPNEAVQRPSEPAFPRSRKRAVALLQKAVPETHSRLEKDWPEELLEAFAGEMSGQAPGTFVPTFDDVLRRVVETGGSPRAWQSVVTTMRAISLARLAPGLPEWTAADDLFQQVRVLIGDVSERMQAQHRIALESWLRTLHETGEALTTTFDLETLLHVVAEQFPRLGVSLCSLALYASNSSAFPSPESRLILAYGTDHLLPSGPGGLLFDSRELAPPGFLPDRRITLIVEPLFFRDEVLGFAIFEMGTAHGRVFEGLREQISGALKGARLVEQVVAEATRREQADRERLERELEIATRIQTTILPRSLRVEGLEIAAVMIPCAEVGGDYYDVIPADGGSWIGIGDVAGHGLQSGLVMLMIQSVISGLVRREPTAAPAELLKALNSVLHDNIRNRLQTDEHATLTLLRYDRGGRLVFAGAHEELIIWRSASRRCECISTVGPWVGAVPSLEGVVNDLECRLEEGDALLLYTDGIIDTENRAGTERFGLERLEAEFEKVAALEVEQVLDRLLAAVRDFGEQTDDVTLLVVRRRDAALPGPAAN
jgi:sigma-B regulation protein RsbU (phosphoserine phosphatase)